MSARRARSCSISTTPTSRCSACRKAASSTAIMTSTAICRSMCSAAGTCCWPGSGARTSPAATARSRRWRASLRRSAGRWPRVRIILRADSGFCQRGLMALVRGEPRRLRVRPGAQSPAWRQRSPNSSPRPSACACARASRRGCSATSAIARSTAGAATRRVVGKAEHTLDGANPRFVVTSLKCTRVGYDARALYEDLYCARGEAENRIGEQFELFADRASSATMQANQLRMWFSAMAYVLVDTLAPRRPAPYPVRRCRGADHSSQAAPSSAPRCAPACAASTSPSPRAAPTRPSSRSPTSISSAPSAPPDLLRSRKTGSGSAARFARHADARASGLVLREPQDGRTCHPRTAPSWPSDPLQPGSLRMFRRSKSTRREVLWHFEQGMYEKSRLGGARTSAGCAVWNARPSARMAS